MMRSQPEGLKVSVGDLKEHPTRYIGQTIKRDRRSGRRVRAAAVQDRRAQLGRSGRRNSRFLPTNLAALVRENDRVTVTGTMKEFPQAQVDRELGWLDSAPVDNARLAKRPILMASRVVGGNSDVAVAIDVSGGNRTETTGSANDAGNGGTAVGNELHHLSTGEQCAYRCRRTRAGDRELVGRHVQLDAVKISRAGHQGFWIETGGRTVFVLPTESSRRRRRRSGSRSRSPVWYARCRAASATRRGQPQTATTISTCTRPR